MSDKILTMFFEPQRWAYAIEKGVGKDIRKDQLIMLCGEKARLKMADMMMKGKYESVFCHRFEKAMPRQIKK